MYKCIALLSVISTARAFYEQYEPPPIHGQVRLDAWEPTTRYAPRKRLRVIYRIYLRNRSKLRCNQLYIFSERSIAVQAPELGIARWFRVHVD